VVDVASGYGRNYLIPRGFAMPWTRGAEKQIELIKRAQSAREIRGLEDAKVIAAQLESLHVRMRRRAGTNGRLFGSVGSADIAEAVREAGGPELDRRRIEVRDPIKTLGSHQVRVRLHPELSAPVDIDIVAS
jgi:large subunit ribosomal protein L9